MIRVLAVGRHADRACELAARRLADVLASLAERRIKRGGAS